MKKILMAALIVALAAVFAVAMVACNGTGGRGGNNGPNEYETGFYTVTFNPNGGTTNSVANLSNIAYGSTIDFPKTESGEPYQPYKKGYVFECWEWTTGGQTREFYFKGDPTHTPDAIVQNTVINARYTAETYEHTLDLRGGLVYEPTSEGGWTYSIDADYYAENEVSVGSEDKYISTFGQNTDFAPARMLAEDNTDKDEFCFWYYMAQLYQKGDSTTTSAESADKDAEGKPIPLVGQFVPKQFTKWKTAGKDEKVTSLERYSFTQQLTLYPMFKSNLPTATVIFENADDTEVKTFGNYKINDTVKGEDAKEAQDALVMGNEFVFDHWFYVLETEDDEDNKVETEYEFYFEPIHVEDEEGNDITPPADHNPTVIQDATGNKGNFTPVTLRLRAKRVRDIKINGSFDAYRSALNDLIAQENAIKERQAADKDYVLSDDDKAVLVALEEYLNAKITIESAITLDENHKPLFDRDHVFKGTITGGEGVTVTAVFTNTDDTTEYSIFGYVGGVVENLTVSVTSVHLNSADGALRFGAIAVSNTGKISGVNVTYANIELSGKENIVFGGICAANAGLSGDSDTGRIENCTVTISGLTSRSGSLVFGAIVGSNLTSTLIQNCKSVTLLASLTDEDVETMSGVHCEIDFGGLVGTNGGTIELSNATLNFNSDEVVAVSHSDLYFGGIAAKSTVIVRTSWTKIGRKASVGSVGDALTVTYHGGNAAIGGLIGSNEGYILNSYSTSYITVSASTEAGLMNIAVGGLIGDNDGNGKQATNPSDTSVGAITYCYAVGSIGVAVDEACKTASVSVGGLSGTQNNTKLTNSFAYVTISVTNSGSDKNYVGYLFGNIDDSEGMANRTCLYYIDDNDGAGLTLNGVTYALEQVEQGEGKDPEYKPNFGSYVGLLVASGEMNAEFFKDNDKLNFDKFEQTGSTSSNPLYVWDLTGEAVEGPLLPTLVVNPEN